MNREEFRNSRRVEYPCMGMSKTIKEWAAYLNMPWSTIYRWLQQGYTLEEIIQRVPEKHHRTRILDKPVFKDLKGMIEWLYDQNIDELKAYDQRIEKLDVLKWDLMRDGIPKLSEVPNLEPKIHKIGDLILCDMVYLAKRFNVPVGLCQLLLANMKVPVVVLGDSAYFSLGVFEKRLGDLTREGGTGFETNRYRLTKASLQCAYGIPEPLAAEMQKYVTALRHDAMARRGLEAKAKAEMPLLHPDDAKEMAIEAEIKRIYGNESE